MYNYRIALLLTNPFLSLLLSTHAMPPLHTCHAPSPPAGSGGKMKGGVSITSTTTHVPQPGRSQRWRLSATTSNGSTTKPRTFKNAVSSISSATCWGARRGVRERRVQTWPPHPLGAPLAQPLPRSRGTLGTMVWGSWTRIGVRVCMWWVWLSCLSGCGIHDIP